MPSDRNIIDKPIPKVVEKEVYAEQYNYAKAQDSIVYMETDNGFVAINSNTGKPLEGEPVLSSEQTSKPVKSKKPEDKKKKKGAEIRQAAIRGSEESPIIPPNRITHKVKPGDTLYSISKEHNCSVEQLKKWNPEITNNVIQAGDELDIYQ